MNQKCFLLFSLFLFSVSFAAAQKKDKDSIFQKLEIHTKKDSIRAKLLMRASLNLTNTNTNSALEYAEKALAVSTQVNWLKGRVQALRQIGVIHYSMASNIEAMEAWQQALIIAEPLNDKLINANLNNNLANIHADLKQYDKALEYYEACLQTSNELSDKSGQIRALTNIGLVYSDIDQMDKGITYFNKALQIAKDIENDFFVAAIVNNLGIAYKRKIEYSKALQYFEKASQMADNLDNKYIKASALNSIGKVNILLENYEIAGINSEKALKIAEEVDAVEWQADSWEILSKVYERKNDNKNALYAYKNFIKLKDSVLNEEKKSELTRKEMQFQLERQQAHADEEIKRQQLIKQMALFGGVLLLLASIIGYILYKKKRDAIEKKKVAEFKSKVSETELKALRSQINPHFVFNAMNSISDYMEKHDVDSANEYLLKFSKLMRSILENSEKKWIPLNEELELIELYIQIESLRLKNEVSYIITIDKDIEPENTLVPPLISQPFIENSIWHGIAKKDSNGHLLIEVKKQADGITFIIEDDGVGRQQSQSLDTNKISMGIKITKSRLDIINKQKQTKNTIKMIDKDQGLKVELQLPLELRF